MNESFFDKYPSYQDYANNYLGAWSFEDGDEVLTIADIAESEMYDTNTRQTKKEMCITFREKDLPMVLSAKTNFRALEYVTGTNKWKEWIGKRVIVGQRLEKVKGKPQMCLRIIPEKPKEETKEPATPEQIACIKALIDEGTITNATAMLKYYKLKTVEEFSRADAKRLIEQKTGEVIE